MSQSGSVVSNTIQLVCVCVCVFCVYDRVLLHMCEFQIILTLLYDPSTNVRQNDI